MRVGGYVHDLRTFLRQVNMAFQVYQLSQL